MALQSYHDESTGKFATRAEYLAAIGKLESDLATEYEQSNAILAELIKKKPEIEALVGQFTREIFVKNHNLLTRTLAGVANGGADAIRGMHGLAYTLVHEPSAMKAAAEAIIADPSLIPKGVWAPFKERIDAGDYAGALGYAIPALVEVVYGSKGGVAAGKGAVETAKTGLDTIQKIVKRDTNRGVQITLNRQNGAAFENQVVDALSHVGGTKNGAPVTVTLPSGKQVTTIPDLWGRNTGGILEVKNVQNLSNSNQLRAQLQLAEETGTPFNLVVSPRTQNISGPLRDRIDEVTSNVGGGIYRYDPSTGNLSNF